MSRTSLAKAAKPVLVNQLTRLPCLVVHGKSYFCRISRRRYKKTVFHNKVIIRLGEYPIIRGVLG